MNNQKNIQKALDDIAIIKQTLKEKKQENVDYQLNGITLSVNVIIQVLQNFEILLSVLSASH